MDKNTYLYLPLIPPSDLLCSSKRVAGERDTGQLGALLRPGARRHRPRDHRGGPRRQGLQKSRAQAARAGHHAVRCRPHNAQVLQQVCIIYQ